MSSGKEEAPLCRKRGGDGSVGERLASGEEHFTKKLGDKILTQSHKRGGRGFLPDLDRNIS